MPPRFIRDPVERITPSVLASLRDDKTEVNDMVIEHARQTVDRLLESS
jgi:carbonic anhydrase